MKSPGTSLRRPVACSRSNAVVHVYPCTTWLVATASSAITRIATSLIAALRRWPQGTPRLVRTGSMHRQSGSTLQPWADGVMLDPNSRHPYDCKGVVVCSAREVVDVRSMDEKFLVFMLRLYVEQDVGHSPSWTRQTVSHVNMPYSILLTCSNYVMECWIRSLRPRSSSTSRIFLTSSVPTTSKADIMFKPSIAQPLCHGSFRIPL